MLGPAIKTKLNHLAPDKVLPIAAVGNGLPAIYYIIREIPQGYSNARQSTDFEIVIITHVKHYDDLWTLGKQIQSTLESVGAKRETVNNIQFLTMNCTDIRDEFEFPLQNYGQRLTFKVKTAPITS